MSKLTKRLTALLLSGMLVIGSAHVGGFAAELGKTSEPAVEETAAEEAVATEEAVGDTAVPVGATEAPAEEAVEDQDAPGATDVPEEEIAQYYTVTLDANGGYFANEWDDAVSDYVERTEILNKVIPVGGMVTTFPVFTDPDGQTMLFAGWSLGPDGELVSQTEEEYIPVDNCVLYAVWKVEDASEGETEDREVADEGTEHANSVLDFEELNAVAEDVVTAEESPVEEDAVSEANTVTETESEQAIVPDQVAVYAYEDIENTSEDSSEATVEEKEIQPELIESSEEEEAVKEDAVNGIVASGTCGAYGDNLTWTLDEEGTLTISGTGEMINYDVNDNRWDSLTINAVVIEKGVTSIGSFAFYNCNRLTNVTIPDSVMSIGYEAFSGCINLASIIIPEGVTNIAAYAFYACRSLTSVVIPDGVTNIGGRAFFECDNLASVTIPDSVTSIGNYAFLRCSSLTSVTIPIGVKRIRESVFFECISLTSVTIPDGVNSIDDSAFYGCRSLTNVTIPDSVTSIGQCAFSGCSSLTSVTIPESVKSIEYGTFSGCRSLESVTIPKKVTNIISYAFSGCSNMTSVTVPDSVISIGTGAFSGCSSLTSIKIPKSVKSIGYEAFSGCSKLINVTISDSISDIDDRAFSGCRSLTSVTIPDSVTNIGEEVFINCDSLNSIIVAPGNSVYSSIDGVLFDKEQVVLIYYPLGKESNYFIPEGVKRIANNAFKWCSNLKSVVIPEGVTTIGDYAFSGCDSLVDVYYDGTRDNWSSISIGTGNECLNNASLHFPPLTVNPVGEQIREVYPGQEVVLEVNASSGYPIHYQWFEDEYDCEIEGEISNSYIISTYHDADFSCHVSDEDGNEAICSFSLKVVTVDNDLKAYVSGWGEDTKALAVSVDPYETLTLEVTAMANEMDGLTYTWYDQDNERIQGATEAIYQTGQLTRNGTICCEVKDKYYNVESVYYNINIDNHLIAYSDSDDYHKDYSDIYVSPGDDLNLHAVVEASDMDDMQYQWLDDQYKEIPGATDTYYSLNNIEDFTYLIFRAIDRYGNKKQVYFYIWIRNPISNAEIVFTESILTYTGKEIMPIVSLFYDGEELFEGDDYSVAYKNNINAGMATVTITGKGYYTGTKTTTFTINKANQSITASNLSLTYSNNGAISTSGNKGKLTYKSSNTAIAVVDASGKITAKGAGSAKITITAAETSNYKKATKTITVTVAKAAQSITAKSSASSVAVGKTATISISGSKGTKSYKSSDTSIATVDKSTGKLTAQKVGTVKITATSAATSNFNAASKTVTVKVVPAATASLTADNQAKGIKLSWKKVTGATGYLVYRGSSKIATIKSGSTVTYTDSKANTNGTKYTYKIIATASTGNGPAKSVTTYCVARPAISSVTNSASKRMTVKWGKNAKASGYQIHYCTDKTFKSDNKSVNINSAGTMAKAIASLTKGKTYYVRIRTYKTVGSTKYFSAWSPVKSVKISK